MINGSSVLPKTVGTFEGASVLPITVGILEVWYSQTPLEHWTVHRKRKNRWEGGMAAPNYLTLWEHWRVHPYFLKLWEDSRVIAFPSRKERAQFG